MHISYLCMQDNAWCLAISAWTHEVISVSFTCARNLRFGLWRKSVNVLDYFCLTILNSTDVTVPRSCGRQVAPSWFRAASRVLRWQIPEIHSYKWSIPPKCSIGVFRSSSLGVRQNKKSFDSNTEFFKKAIYLRCLHDWSNSFSASTSGHNMSKDC